MTPAERHSATCPHCGRRFEYERYHAGFSDEGYMYCDHDETVLTWHALGPAYRRVVAKLPWMLETDEQRRVEESLKQRRANGQREQLVEQLLGVG